jgi:hypothetical protein
MRIVATFLQGLVAIALVGCSVYSAATRPDYKDASVFAPSARRSELINQFGQPCRSYQKDNIRYDVFEASDAARTSGSKAMRATGYALLDVVTIGVGEFWGSEVETEARRKCTTYTVSYTPEGNAQSVETREWVLEPPPTAAAQPAGYCGIDYHAPACEGKQT